MKYKYSTVSGAMDMHGRFVKRPIVEIAVSRGSLRRPFLALVDSGADDIIMPAAIAEAFGIERASCRPHATVGISMQPIAGFVAPITIHVEHQPQPFDAEVVFIDTDVPILLGRNAFFDNYRIRFEQDHHVFEISEAP